MLAGTGRLIQLYLRRDRFKLPVAIAGFVALLFSVIPLLRETYGDQASLDALYQTFSISPAGLFMTGPMDDASLGGLMSVETLLWWGLLIAFINTMLVIRHTRHNEEIGAQELLLSAQVHRGAGLLAALMVAAMANVVIVVGTGLVMTLESAWTTQSAWLFAVSMGLFGMVWAAVAAVVAQLTQSGRAANGMLAGLVGLSFLVRGIGDFMGKIGQAGLHEPAWYSYLSPLGWLQMTRPLTAPDWWPLAVMATFTLAAISLAFILLNLRDVGSGLLPARQGRERAKGWLLTPLGLTWRLQRNVFMGWLVGVVVTVATIGALVPQMNQVLESTDSMRQMVGIDGASDELVPAFMSAMMAITAIMVFAYTIHGMMRLRAEESYGHLESLLSTRLSRASWLWRHVAIILIGSTIMLAAIGLILALIINSSSDIMVGVGEYTLAGLSYLPLALLFIGLYVLLFAILPRLTTGLVWVYFGFVAFIAWLGPMLGIDDDIARLSAMEHLATPPVESIDIVPLIVISGLAVALLAIGSISWRKRDLLDS